MGSAAIRAFVSYDREHDGDLYDLLDEQSAKGSFGFEISARSRAPSPMGAGDERVRREIQEADQVIVICGEHTEASISVSAELRIAQEEGTPYFLLWGRRESMCCKPIGAKPADGMYSWTRQILQDQVRFTSRRDDAEVVHIPRNATRKA